jgi:signal transduction histidine kinase
MQTDERCAFLEPASGWNGVMNVQLAIATLEVAAPHARLGLDARLSGCRFGHARIVPRSQLPLRSCAGGVNCCSMERLLPLACLCALLGGCGLADTGAAAAGSAASAAQQAAEAKRTEERVREQIEAANREAAERERAAADAASK